MKGSVVNPITDLDRAPDDFDELAHHYPACWRPDHTLLRKPLPGDRAICGYVRRRPFFGEPGSWSDSNVCLVCKDLTDEGRRT
jgi:hypothetical protein